MINYDRVKYAVDDIKMRSGDICRQFPKCMYCPYHDTKVVVVDGVAINTVDYCMFIKFSDNWDKFNAEEVTE